MSPTHTVILGGGIVGLSTAYFLSESGHTDPRSIVLIDSSEKLLHCASGFAGGFCAKDWFAPSVAPLGALSFSLHKRLADEHNGRATWGYNPSTGISLSQDSESESAICGSGEDWLENGTSRAQQAAATALMTQLSVSTDESSSGGAPKWLRRTSDSTIEVISCEGTTAQIDPMRFCRWLLAQCEERGVTIIYPARAVGVLRDERGVLDRVRISKDGTETSLPCTRLLIAAGAWSPRVFATLFPQAQTRIPISCLAGHSLLVRNPLFEAKAKAGKDEICHAVFATDTLGFAPEWFARAGGELYLAGLNSTNIKLPEVATDVVPSEKAIEQLTNCAKAMLTTVDGRDVQVLRQGLCFRPVTSSGRPLVSRVPDEKLGGIKTRGAGQGGVFISGGHGAWGISHAPGTGLVLAEMMEGRPTSAKVEALKLPA